jgi:hypothetical protein
MMQDRKAARFDETSCNAQPHHTLGSVAPLTSPGAANAAMTGPIDCGRIPSARARADAVAGPPRSSRSNTDTCAGVRSPTARAAGASAC